MNKSRLLTIVLSSVGLLSACLEAPEADKELSDMEEPSSEPAGEASDSEGGSSGSEGSSGSSDGADGSGSGGNGSDNGGGSDGGSNDGSWDDSSDGTGGTLNPDILLFTFQNGYAADDVASATFYSTGESLVGTFSLILYDSMTSDYCAVDWIFDETTVAPDSNYADGFVTDAFYGLEMDVWYGYVVLSQPTTRESCDALTSDWLVTLDEIKADRPGFGYGPLEENLMMSLQSDGYYPWDTVSDTIFSAIPSMTVFNEGERSYFPVNIGFAYQLDSNGVTEYDPNGHELPQGSELSLSNLPGDAFYIGGYYYGISLGGH